jgi:hypothetical protein
MLLTTSGTISLRHSSNLQGVATRIASKEIEHLRDLDFANLPASGSFTDPDMAKLPAGSAIRTVSNYQSSAQIKQVNITVSWQINGANRDVKMETLIYQYGI